ncbi:MAG: NAD(P)/FAD-dependent oxidoreductase [Bacteroidota bacterium]|nr:NAD(P)/FAD-dependent oxidoreductase [Bacteroidota bacterium]
MKKYDVIVVGAGAAGLIAAGRAAELGAKVLLIEKMERAGRKLLITGKGRCNITNEAPMSEFFKHIYPNGRFLKHAFATFFAGDIVKLLADHDVETNVERGGRIFPVSNLSADVVQALLRWVNKNRVEIRYGTKIEKLIVSDGRICGIEVLSSGKTETLEASNVIVCTGGSSYPATGSNGEGYKLSKAVGHSIEPVLPALVPLETEGDLAERLQGVSLKNVNAVVWVNGKKQKEEFGEMLFTHFGLSGPIILTLSRFVVDELRKNNKVEISVDLKPALDEQKLDARLIRDLNEHGKKRIANIFSEWLPSKMIPVFIDLAGVDATKECHQMSAKERRKIMLLMKDLRFKVTGNRSFKEAIITAGGVSTKEVDSKTMESKFVKGLYFAGEILDLDADTGGYNLQIAWSTGWLAAQSSVNSLQQS